MKKIIKIVITLLVVIAFAVLPSVTALASMVTPNDADPLTVSAATTESTTEITTTVSESISESVPDTGSNADSIVIVLVGVFVLFALILYR